jgi:ribonuclease R
MEIQIALRKHQLPHIWSESIEQEAARYHSDVTDADKAARKDIRDLPLVTIDGEDARDFDDAVYCEALEGGNTRLVVAIADVSHYVKQGSAIDQEAWLRGNSVYFPNNVIPMLPEVLSNGLCSLNPKVNRLCFVCDLKIDQAGEIIEYDFFEGLMYSHARLTYTQVAKLIDGNTDECDIEPDLQKQVLALYQLSRTLRTARNQHGTIDFDVPEPVIIFDENRKIESVVARERNEAHRLIEECMLAANICASLCLDESDLVGIYRVHESPEPDKIADVREFLRQFKLLLNGGDQPEPKFYAEVMAKVDDPLTLKIVQTALLRSMKQARYSEENLGHFALNFDSYTHFTSPIRRYSDLLVHRQIKRLLIDRSASDDDQMLVRVSQTAEQTSMTERRADSATRDVIQWLKCEYMSHRIGEKMWGTVTSVTDFGLFVELNDLYIDGLVHITSLGQDYYRFDESKRLLRGEHTNTEYKTGQPLEVQVSRVDMEQGRIDFELVDVIKLKHSSKSNKSFSKKGSKKVGIKKRADKPRKPKSSKKTKH